MVLLIENLQVGICLMMWLLCVCHGFIWLLADIQKNLVPVGPKVFFLFCHCLDDISTALDVL